ncbi:MAG: serine hydrolase [Candidatus Heimdallarchaeaceae archaeon]
MRNIDVKPFKEKFEHEVVKVMRDLKIPGMSILITQNGEILYQRAFGIIEKVKVRPATLDTLYGVSSITKSVTSMGVLQLHQKEKLNIDEPLANYLPFEIEYIGQPIKIKHIMSHASGVPSLMTFYFSQMNQKLYKAKAPEFPMGNWEDFFFHINDAQSELLSPPERKYYYWNGGFVLLGKLIEEVSGLAYEKYIKKNILEPLEMHRSTFSLEEAKTDNDASVGFNFGLEQKMIKREQRDLLSGKFIAGAGGLISSVREITNYLQCYLNKGKFKEREILDSSLIDEMLRPHNSNIQSQYYDYNPEATVAYGYGWKIFQNFHGHNLVTHGGMSGVTGGYVGFIRDLGITYAQLQNVNYTPSLLMFTAFNILLGYEPKEIMPYYKRKLHYETLCGQYEAYKKTITLEVVKKGDMLFVKGDNWYSEFELPLIPKNKDHGFLYFDRVWTDGCSIHQASKWRNYF